MRILEIGEYPYVSPYAPDISDFFSVLKQPGSGQKLTRREILRLRKRLKAGDYDLVVYRITQKVTAPWRRRGGLNWKSIFDFLFASLFSFHKISWHFLHRCLCGTHVPLVVIDTQDVPHLTETEALWLDRSQLWFMRELPPNHLNLFLNMNRRTGDVTNIRRQEIVMRNLDKIRPFSLGFDPVAGEGPPPAEKIYDLFFAGSVKTSTMRWRGLEELRALRAAGWRVYLPEERLSPADFHRACSQSWLVWSPEGQGWDCHRHYEVLLAHSVPLINTPTIERLWPLRHGEHCLFFEPEVGRLTIAVETALTDRKALLRIVEQGRDHILKHHARDRLVRHVLAELGLLERADSHILDVKNSASAPKSPPPAADSPSPCSASSPGPSARSPHSVSRP